MCGISGFLSLSGQTNISQPLLKKMNRAQSHRGPDAEGYFIEQGIGLGHRRLSIIDIESGQQPMFDDQQNLVIVFNGEIYNFLEVNQLLAQKGHVFATRSDTETILHAYQEWGVDCLEHLTGMFVFAIWDKASKQLFMARDRIGEKPLFYCLVNDNELIFGSELKVLKAHPNFSNQLNVEAVEDYFTLGYVPESKSIYQHVGKLLPGHYLVVQQPAAQLPVAIQYWDLPSQADTSQQKPQIVYEKFKQVVKKRMMSEVPLGAFLSGGVDSSAVVAAMAQLDPQTKVSTCTIGFDVAQFNESPHAAKVATRYNTEHHVDIVSHDDFSLIEQLTDIYDEPFADSSALPTFKVCQVAKRYVSVCLSGDGGDELFAGYRRYRLHGNEEKVRSKIPLAIRAKVFGLLGRIYPKADWAPRFMRAKTTFQSLAMPSWKAYLNSVSKIRQDDRANLYSDAFSRRLQTYSSDQVFSHLVAGKTFDDPIKQAQYLDLKTWLPSDILTKVDRASMANSLEVRVPMLDHHFVEWAFAIDTQLNMQGNQGKAIFKQALEPHLSHDTLYRDKMGFSIPLNEWLRGPLKEPLLQAIEHPNLAALEIFDGDKLMDMYRCHQSQSRDFSAELWTLYVFSLFVQKNKVHW